MTFEEDNWQTLSTKSDEEIVAWASRQSWSQPMKECGQDPIWHAEGDVWTHTEMVCQELYRLAEWEHLDRIEQLKLLFTAIFHDAGKPKVTMVEPGTGRIRSPHHAEHGMRIARRALMKLECDFQLREAICHLVLFHGRPPYLGKKKSAESEIIKLSHYVNHRLLHLFALADYRGRICKERSIAESSLDYWKLVAEELDCLNRPFPFSNDHARVLFYRDQLDNLHYEPYEDYACQMTILSGLPASGKDTWIESNLGHLPVISMDSIRNDLQIDPTENQGRVAQAAKQKCKSFLRTGQDFVFNATNTSRRVRRRWTELAHDYRANVRLVYLEPTIAEIKTRNQQRETSVPESIIDQLVGKLDPPTKTECHDLMLEVEP